MNVSRPNTFIRKLVLASMLTTCAPHARSVIRGTAPNTVLWASPAPAMQDPRVAPAVSSHACGTGAYLDGVPAITEPLDARAPFQRSRFFLLTRDRTRCDVLEIEQSHARFVSVARFDARPTYVTTLMVGLSPWSDSTLLVRIAAVAQELSRPAHSWRRCLLWMQLRGETDGVLTFEEPIEREGHCLDLLPALDRWFTTCEACFAARAPSSTAGEQRCPEAVADTTLIR